MGYRTWAFIAPTGTFDELKALGDRVSVIHLNNAIDMLLDDPYLYRALGISETSPWKEQSRIFRAKSRGTIIAYIRIDYHAGIGSQQAVVWKDRQQVLHQKTEIALRPESYGPVNTALRLLGVQATDDHDEFEVVGLHRHRHMENWFEEATGVGWRTYIEDLA